MASPPRVFSGIQPSGDLHLGNYVGALRQWVQNQDQYDNIFCIVDLHAITTPQDPSTLRERVLSNAAWYIAAGIDPEQSVIFVQSANPDHAYLSWILNNYTSVGELSRMTQFKEKSAQEKFVSAGLYDYPVLMAADILLYDTNLVPVGQDQKQHIELTRDIAQRFNSRHGREVFVVPEYMPPPAGERIMSLQDPHRKMSKSATDPKGTIDLKDDADTIREKVMTAVTDSGDEVKIAADKPAISNLATIFIALTDESEEDLDTEYSGRGYQKFKADLAEVIIEELQPIQERYEEVRGSGELDAILEGATARARVISSEKVAKVKSVIGLGPSTPNI